MSRVVVERAGLIESAHRVHVAVVDARGRLTASVGDSDRIVFHRSAAKPLQAVPLVDDKVADRFGLTTEELALCCASHNGEPEHLSLVRSILSKVDLDESDLECGPHLPLGSAASEALLRSGGAATSIHNNCSGKHAGMLALAVAHGWPTRGYVRRDHPVQVRMIAEVSRWTQLQENELRLGQDGCGVVSFATPLARLAAAFARLGGAVGPANQIVSAMCAHPFLVAGTGRFGTALGDAAGDRLFGKTGAEGVFAVGATDGSFGMAAKVEDGAKRAIPVAVLHVLDHLGALDDIESEALDAFRCPGITNTLGEVVGSVRADIRLERHG